jgi:hypothetical protein
LLHSYFFCFGIMVLTAFSKKCVESIPDRYNIFNTLLKKWRYNCSENAASFDLRLGRIDTSRTSSSRVEYRWNTQAHRFFISPVKISYQPKKNRRKLVKPQYKYKVLQKYHQLLPLVLPITRILHT